jgi:hypothetical protein
MKFLKGCTALITPLATLVMSAQCLAVPITYTDVNAFAQVGTSLAHSFTTHTFLSEHGQTIANGDSITIPHSQAAVNVTFSYDFGNFPNTQNPIQIVGTDGTLHGGGGPFPSTSSGAFLGTNDGDLFLDGDDISLSFDRSLSLLGMFFISADQLLDNDIQLTASGVTVGIDASNPMMTWQDGSAAYFLGIIDTVGSIADADITTSGGGHFFYNIDDIMVATYEPETILLLATGLFGIFIMQQRRKSNEGGIKPHI